jgi:hypothetical protein
MNLFKQYLVENNNEGESLTPDYKTTYHQDLIDLNNHNIHVREVAGKNNGS